MNKQEFVDTFLEGCELTPFRHTIESLLSKLYDERETVKSLIEKHENVIEFMNDVARDSDWSMKCNSCGDDYTPDCELSEMFGSENYCGKNQWCCP